MTNSKQSWFNDEQIRAVSAIQKFKTLVCGRGWGKSSLIALIVFMILKHLPRSKGFLAAKTIEQIEDEILPQVRKKLKSLGVTEGVHYVVGKTPPEWFEKPISPIKNYIHAISFWNGTVIRLLSHARPNSRRGGTYDWGIIDEALEMKESTFDSVFSQLIRGNLYTYNHSLHHSLFILTSRPQKSTGYWVYRFRELAQKKPLDYYYYEGAAKDNIVALGEKWFEQQKERLSPIKYATEIENQEINQLPDGYFYLFQRGKHTYTPRMNENRQMLDIEKDELLELSFDFGGKFSCASVWQQRGEFEYLRRRYWVKNEKKVPHLIDDFCNDNKDHQYKYVRLWGEPRGRDRNAMDVDYYEQIQQRLLRHGWASDVMTPAGYQIAKQSVIYDYIELVLGEEDAVTPRVRINEVCCEDTIIAIETADVLSDRGLDKSKEKDDSYPQELATHQVDNVRYYLYMKHGLKMSSIKRSGRVHTA